MPSLCGAEAHTQSLVPSRQTLNQLSKLPDLSIFRTKDFFKIKDVFYCVCAHVHACHSGHSCRHQRLTYRSQASSTVWVLQIELKSKDWRQTLLYTESSHLPYEVLFIKKAEEWVNKCPLTLTINYY